ncbi:MAG: hypothetical protein QOI55_2920 [Actinomycetota bacterium]|nr:hypothetical protein [Actinomycetota bacterium]
MDHRHDPGRDAPVARSLWRHARDLAFDADRTGKVLDASPAARAWLGDRNLTLLDAVHAQDAERLLQLLTGEPPERADFRFANLPPAAGFRVLEINATTPTARGAVIVARDVTHEHQALGTLRAHREVLSLIADREPLPAVLDALARSMEEASGGARVAVFVVRDTDLELAAAPSLRADVAGAFARLRDEALPGAFPAAGALSGRCAEVAAEHGLGFGWAAPVLDGDEALAVLVLFPGAKRFPSADEQAALEAGAPLAQVAIAAHRARADLQRAMRDDALTGVFGRQAFVDELTHLARRSRDSLGVAVVQVDGIAALNERAGFAAGDAVLETVAARLAGTVRGRDIVGRCSGTRFAVACAALGRHGTMDEFTQRVRRVLEEPVIAGGAAQPFSVRIGCATRRGRNDDPGFVLRDAERAIEPELETQLEADVEAQEGRPQADRDAHHDVDRDGAGHSGSGQIDR